MLHLEQFFGSPAFCFLMALLPMIVYVLFVTWYCDNVESVRPALALCLLDFFVAILFYIRSLQFYLEFSLALAYRCLAQALVAGFVVGTLLLKIPGQHWNVWRYLAAVMVVTLFVVLLHDVGFVMLHQKKLPVFKILQRVRQTAEQGQNQQT